MARPAPKVDPQPAEGRYGSFANVPVTALAIALREGGDGFSDALEIGIEPSDTGTRRHVVLECVVGPIDHDPLLDDGRKAKKDELVEFSSYRRVEDWVVKRAIPVREEQVAEWLSESAERAERIRAERVEREQREAEEEAGIMRLVED